MTTGPHAHNGISSRCWGSAVVNQTLMVAWRDGDVETVSRFLATNQPNAVSERQDAGEMWSRLAQSTRASSTMPMSMATSMPMA